jgi:hypothetical protein
MSSTETADDGSPTGDEQMSFSQLFAEAVGISDKLWNKFPRSLALLLDITHGHGLASDPAVEEQIRKRFVDAIKADDEMIGEFFLDLRRQSDPFCG